ncbi:unnamed protein product [Chondrus crispus]|uniref:Probable ATP-dependent transporter ycf16 n=1 Tax=Chondrus crispus TaxID=2769 RepID=R7Q832_CHOCR|nr:unnamed protein product [Chondrus crispus]CDF34707.1 unnamed protein product [Chondrus crispus]|eukprot:XP_005714526.1 unnamed protein product [Chondrus crispus]
MHPAAPSPDLETDLREQALAKQRQDPRRLWALFWSIARPYWRYAPGARASIAWVVFLGLVRSGLSVIFSYISRDFWTALQKKDVAMFWRQITMFSVVLLCALPILVWYGYAKDRLALTWRKWHTEKILGDYFAKRTYYEIDQRGTVDNPDQRIAEDVKAFTSTSLMFFMSVLMSCIDLVNFSIILFRIYPKLFIVLGFYSTFGTVVATLIGRRMINLNFLQLRKEADFRYSLIRIRENAESIAFYSGEGREKVETERRFDSAVLNQLDLIVWTRNLAFFTTSYAYLIQILPLSIIAPLYFTGAIELGVVSQSQQAFHHVLEDLSLIVNEFDRLSQFSAGIDRLGELEEFIYARFAEGEDRRSKNAKDPDSFDKGGVPGLDDSDDGSGGMDDSPGVDVHDAGFAKMYGRADGIARYRKLREKATSADDEFAHDLLLAEGGAGDVHISTKITPNGESKVVVKNLTLMTPDKHHRVLFEDLSFTLEPGQRLLIVGPSGTGKSSALRALAGLWNRGRGSVMRPPLSSMFFLPQRPYCTLGSLREQLVYPTPLHESSATEEELIAALELVNLEKLPGRMGGFDEFRDWSTVLSLGEQQRLAFARLTIGRPQLAILDECSSALDVASEERLYSHLRESGIGYISVGHRPSLFQYHDIVLRLGAPGAAHDIEPIGPGSS